MNTTISSKDLSYVCDMFSWNENIINTINLLKEKVTNQQLLQIMDNMLNFHKNNIQNIKGILDAR